VSRKQSWTKTNAAKFRHQHTRPGINTITWFNGLILGLAADTDFEAIGLFDEISETTTPQPLAAKSILKAFAKVENMQLAKGLDKQYESILEDIGATYFSSRNWLTIK